MPLFVQNLFLSTLNISKTKFIISSFIGFSPYFLFFSFIGNQFSDLIEKKFAYVRNNNVFFSCKKFSAYGKLSGKNIASLQYKLMEENKTNGQPSVMLL